MNTPTSAALIAQIDSLAVPHGQLALWSLGQAGFVIKGGTTIAYIDPYLSDPLGENGQSRRRFPIPIDPSAVNHAQIVHTSYPQPGIHHGARIGAHAARSHGVIAGRAMLAHRIEQLLIGLHLRPRLQLFEHVRRE